MKETRYSNSASTENSPNSPENSSSNGKVVQFDSLFPLENHAERTEMGSGDDFSSETIQTKGKKKKTHSGPNTAVSRKQVEEIYRAYPRHVAKQVALRAIERALCHVEFEYLIEKVRQYAASPLVQSKLLAGERNYIPHPSTWFNQCRWEDDPIEWGIVEEGEEGGVMPQEGAAPPASPSEQEEEIDLFGDDEEARRMYESG